MLKGSRAGACAAVLAAGLLSIPNSLGTPTSNETLTAEGCIDIAGGKAVFDLSATYTLATDSSTGSLSYRDTAAGFEFTSSSIADYSETDSNMRGFTFALTDGPFAAARVFVMDNGTTGDQFLIQLFDTGGFIVYEASGTLSTDCGGGVVITGDGGTPPPTPEPPPGKKHPKGNNGVGNGIDPQPPGNPPINDGPGTGPGNPGNRGGADPKNRKGK